VALVWLAHLLLMIWIGPYEWGARCSLERAQRVGRLICALLSPSGPPALQINRSIRFLSLSLSVSLAHYIWLALDRPTWKGQVNYNGR